MKTVPLAQLYIDHISYSDIKFSQNSAGASILYENSTPIYFSFQAGLLSENIHVLTSKSYVDIFIQNEEYINKLKEFDDYNINFVSQKSKMWFGQQVDLDNIREMYSPLLLKKKDKHFIRVKINTSNDLPLFKKNRKTFCDGILIDEQTFAIDNVSELGEELVDINIEFKGLRFGKTTFWCDFFFDSIDTFVYQEPVSVLADFSDENCSKFITDELDTIANISNSSSVTFTLPTLEKNKFCFFEGDENYEDEDIINYKIQRKHIALQKNQKYLNKLENLQRDVELQVQKRMGEVEILKEKQHKITEMHQSALQFQKVIEQPSYEYTTDDELIEQDIEEHVGEEVFLEDF